MSMKQPRTDIETENKRQKSLFIGKAGSLKPALDKYHAYEEEQVEDEGLWSWYVYNNTYCYREEYDYKINRTTLITEGIILNYAEWKSNQALEWAKTTMAYFPYCLNKKDQDLLTDYWRDICIEEENSACEDR